MGLFDRLKKGLTRTKNQFVHELRRILSGSPKLTADVVEEIEANLIGADLGLKTTNEILDRLRRAYETQGSKEVDALAVAADLLKERLSGLDTQLARADSGPTVISLVGVNGVGKTTTAARLAWRIREAGGRPVLAACDTFRAAAVEQLKTWGERLDTPVIAGAYGADPASVAHDAVSAALAREADYLMIDTAGRLHTKSNLMQELQKTHRVIGKKLEGAPHETLLVLDATTGMNALAQAREFHRAAPLTGLVVTKLDGTSKGGMVVAIQRELKIPVKFIGVGETAEDLQPFDAEQFVDALFSE